jgi:formyltetrahydrofolate hydrolase
MRKRTYQQHVLCICVCLQGLVNRLGNVLRQRKFQVSKNSQLTPAKSQYLQRCAIPAKRTLCPAQPPSAILTPEEVAKRMTVRMSSTCKSF